MSNDFKKDLGALKSAVDSVVEQGIDISQAVNDGKAVYDFDERKRQYYVNGLGRAVQAVRGADLSKIAELDIANKKAVDEINGLMPKLDVWDIEGIGKAVDKMIELSGSINFPEPEKKLFVVPRTVPPDIRADMVADLEEIDKCFKAGCYRSVVVLCGRVLETALHRKYYEVTGKDILEKNPGIGLGNLIGKLSDKKVILDPALKQQVHLINQVRVFSVHKKQEAFLPSMEQAHAIILYSIDVLGKIFQDGNKTGTYN